MRRILITALAVLAASPAVAQDYPLPRSVSEPPAICTTCPPPHTGLPTQPYDVPIVGFAGRYLDSTSIPFFPFPARTYRANEIAIVRDLDRIFMKIGGGTFATYELSTFLAAQLGSPMATGPNGEAYLPFFSSVYPEAPGSGWSTFIAEGEHRLQDFDWDSRGYRYLAYSVFGWGIVRDDGSLVTQIPMGSFPADEIAYFRDGASHYVAVSPGTIVTEIYDVTDPVTPILVRTLPFGFRDEAKASNGISDTIALVAPPGLRIFDASALAGGAPPEAEFTAQSGRSLTQVVTDGLRFLAMQSRTGSTPMSLSIVANENGAWTETIVSSGDPIFGLTLSLEGGVFVVTGFSSTLGDNILRLYRLENGAIQQIDVNHFFEDYYVRSIGAHAVPPRAHFMDGAPFFHDGNLLVFAAAASLGDVYRLDVTPNSPPSLEPVSPGPTPVGTELRFTLTAPDPEGETVRFLSIRLPDGATLDPSTGEFVWTPAPDQIGDHAVRLGAADPDAVSAWTDVVLVVPPPAASLGGADITEGAAGTSSIVTLTVMLSTPSASEVSVDWATADGSATAGADYLAASGTLVFAPGETAKTIELTILGDDDPESDETFDVTLSAPAGATLAVEAAEVTIVSDDAAAIPLLSPWMLAALLMALAAAGAMRVRG